MDIEVHMKHWIDSYECDRDGEQELRYTLRRMDWDSDCRCAWWPWAIWLWDCRQV